MQVCTLTVLPAHPAQMPVLTKNATMQGREDGPSHNGPQVPPVLKRQGGKLCFIALPHSCRSSRGAHLGRWFFISSAAAAAVAVVAAASGGTTAC